MELNKILLMCIVALSALVANVSLSLDNITVPSDNVALAYIINERCGPANKVDFGDQLYNSVITADYETAVIKSLRLENEGRGEVVANVVAKLLANTKKNVMEFAYKLWTMFGKNIVKDYFPIQFRLILNENLIMISDKRYGLALNLDVVTNEGDRRAFGDGVDKSGSKLSWKLYPIWENNRVYFKIKNIYRYQYIKLQVATDQRGDRIAWGTDNDDTYRHQWYLHPVKYENETLFYIYNREYNKALRLATEVNTNGDRHLWGHNGDVTGHPELFGWIVTPL